jgi:hypothetical protein
VLGTVVGAIVFVLGLALVARDALDEVVALRHKLAARRAPAVA